MIGRPRQEFALPSSDMAHADAEADADADAGAIGIVSSSLMTMSLLADDCDDDACTVSTSTLLGLRKPLARFVLLVPVDMITRNRR